MYKLHKADELNYQLTHHAEGAARATRLGYISTSGDDPHGVAESLIYEHLLGQGLPELRAQCRQRAAMIAKTLNEV